MITGKDILEDMYKAVKGLADKTFLIERPAATSANLGSFIVCTLPSEVYNETIGDGGEYGMYSTTAQFEVFVRDKTSSANINAIDIVKMGALVKSLKALFPIITDHCTISRPVETLSISDGKQFHCTIIQAQVTTK